MVQRRGTGRPGGEVRGSGAGFRDPALQPEAQLLAVWSVPELLDRGAPLLPGEDLAQRIAQDGPRRGECLIRRRVRAHGAVDLDVIDAHLADEPPAVGGGERVDGDEQRVAHAWISSEALPDGRPREPGDR